MQAVDRQVPHVTRAVVVPKRLSYQAMPTVDLRTLTEDRSAQPRSCSSFVQQLLQTTLSPHTAKHHVQRLVGRLPCSVASLKSKFDAPTNLL